MPDNDKQTENTGGTSVNSQTNQSADANAQNTGQPERTFIVSDILQIKNSAHEKIETKNNSQQENK